MFICVLERQVFSMYNVNQIVSYGPQGIYRIGDIAEKNLTGKKVKYYILKSVKGNNSTIYVPVDNETLVGKIRPVLSADQVYRLINKMPNDDLEWIENDDDRKTQFKAIISESAPEKLAQLIKMVYIHQRELEGMGKKLHVADERAFKEAERILYDEFSLVLDVKSDSVPSFIQAAIGETV